MKAIGTAIGIVAVADLITPAAVAQQAPPAQPSPVRRLHDTMIKPGSAVIFNVGREAPRNGRAWADVSTAGTRLIRAATLMAREAPAHDRPAWIDLSRQLAAAGRAARTAAEMKNVDALTLASDRLLIVCETCHAPFRKPVTPAAPRSPAAR